MSQNIVDWQDHDILTRPDGSYVVTISGSPYHVPNSGEWADLWADVSAWESDHPEQVRPEPGPPEPTLEEAQTAKRGEIDAAYEAALVAALTMPSADPSPMTVAVETSALLAVDPDGVDSIKSVLDARREELRALVRAAATVGDVEAVGVEYPV